MEEIEEENDIMLVKLQWEPSKQSYTTNSKAKYPTYAASLPITYP